MGSDKSFVVAWEEAGVRARVFDASGAPRSSVIKVGELQDSDRHNPTVSIDARGNFTVAWTRFGAPNPSGQVLAQRFGRNGNPLGQPFGVSSSASTNERNVSVSVGPAGEMLFAWERFGQDDILNEIYARQFDAAGTALGGEFRINNTISGNQLKPAIARDQRGDMVVAWSGNGPGDDIGVFARRFFTPPLPGEDRRGPQVLNSSPIGTAVAPVGAVQLIFNEPLDSLSFTIADISSFSGPGGPIQATGVSEISGSNRTAFEITFAPERQMDRWIPAST